jgi:hypothetical protein
MEPNELKATWQRMEEVLERGNRLTAELLRRQNVDAAQKSLRPLKWGQIMQILFGVCFLALAAVAWANKPTSPSVIASAITVQIYGIGCIITAGSVLSSLRRIDYAGPVVNTQTGLAKVRRTYGISILIAGLSWWFLWIVLLMLVVGLGHIDLYAHARSWIQGDIVVGIAGWFGIYGLFRYAAKSNNMQLRRFVERVAFGRSLSAAMEQIAEIRKFEKEVLSVGL